MKPLGIYIHIPFCKSKCLYCDFCSLPRPDGDLVKRYTAALMRELEEKAVLCHGHTVDTVFFGGGTPTYLPPAALCGILETVAKHYHIAKNPEITAECNPATGDSEYFFAMRSSGFNRLSIGLQSVHRGELRALGRIHTFEDFSKTVADARAGGFANISADLMFGIPAQTPESFFESIDALAAVNLEHISAYGLTVEENTPFGRMGARLSLPGEEDTRRMYTEGIERLFAAGYLQYEISNFARSGYESRHNLKYWNCDEYLGLGVAAHSDFCGVRTGNSGDIAAYIEGRDICAEREIPSKAGRKNEYVMLAMRLCSGVSGRLFETKFGGDFEREFGHALARFIPLGLVQKTPDGYAFTKEGMYVSNAILSEVLDFSD